MGKRLAVSDVNLNACPCADRAWRSHGQGHRTPDRHRASPMPLPCRRTPPWNGLPI